MDIKIFETTKETLFSYGGTFYKHVFIANSVSGLAYIFKGNDLIYDPYRVKITQEGKEVEAAFTKHKQNK